MFHPYEKTYRLRSVLANEIVAVPFPTNTYITKLLAVEMGGAASFTIDVYSRAFDNMANAITSITTAAGSAKVTFDHSHKFRPGEKFVVAGSSVGGYNTTHTVVTVLTDKSVVTDIAYSSDATGGTATLRMAVAVTEEYSNSDPRYFGLTVVVLEGPHPHRIGVGDVVTIAGHSDADYNSTFEVLQVGKDAILINKVFAGAGTGGTISVNIEDAEKPVYHVMPQIDGTDGEAAMYEPDGHAFVNHDAYEFGTMQERALYLQFSAAGDYRVTIAAKQVA